MTIVSTYPRHIEFRAVHAWADARGINRARAVREFMKYVTDRVERCVWCGADVRQCDGYACGGKQRHGG